MGLGSGIRKKPIPDPGSGSRGQKGTGSRIRIRNTGGGGAGEHTVYAVQTTLWMYLEAGVLDEPDPAKPA
jgi:hypothetical protein